MSIVNRIAVVIPAYNEEESIAAVVNEVNRVSRETGLDLTPVVVNDCSTDRTREIISQLNCVALNLPINLGIGGAVQTGFKYALLNGFDYAVQIDGDGQHPPAQIPLLYNAIQQNNWDVAIGSRFITNEGFQSTFMRRVGIAYFQWLIRLLTGRTVKDATSGMRMFNRKTLALFYRYYPDEYPEPEAVILFSKNNLRFGEVPVQMNERMGGVSSIRSFGTVYYMFKVTLAIIFSYLRK
ncbi:MAG: glycosyltransferase family 2 protein [Chitinophagales bacterium]|nr:glycosyltransferase family 2 protein [Chitinophagales bacterium]MDW8419228.1 glycosyltransferase family 2 protein [Chitinophagales bacterium]